jgi:hypothetical protein
MLRSNRFFRIYRQDWISALPLRNTWPIWSGDMAAACRVVLKGPGAITSMFPPSSNSSRPSTVTRSILSQHRRRV